MNALIALLSLVTAGSSGAPVLDPGRLIPEDMTVFVEVRDPAQQIQRLQRSAGWKEIEAQVPAPVREFLGLVTASGLKRAALGLDHSFLRKKTVFVLLLEADDQGALMEQAKAVAKESKSPVFRAGPFVGIADSRDTADEVRDVAAGEEDSMLDRDDFTDFRKRVTTGDIRFHVDLKGLLPLRPGVAEPKDPGAALLSAHLLHVAGRAREFSGFVDLARGLKIEMSAPIGRLPKDRRFCVPQGPAPDVLVGPDDHALRLSLRRDLAGFWKHVEALVPEGARPGLAEFRSNAALLMGGLAVEDLFAGLGSTFDVYVGRLPKDGPQPRNRYPVAALVAEVKTKRIAQELMLGFQETIGAVNLGASQEGKPRFMLGSVRHRDVDVLTARYLPSLLPEKDDDRLQLEISFAIVGQRLVLGSHSSVVKKLVDAAVDGRTVTRSPGDVLRMTASRVKTLVEDARDAIVAGLVVDQGRTVDQAGSLVDTIGWYLDRAQTLSVDLVFQNGNARFDLDLVAPELWKSAKGQDK